MLRYRTALMILIMGLVASLNSLWAQSINGIIAGRVVDPSGAPTTATITATNRETGKSYTAVAGEDGNYRVLEVGPGNYDVKADSLGFLSVVYQNVRVDVNRTTNQDFKLLIPPEKATVTVQAYPSNAKFLDTAQPTLHTDFSSRDVEQIPILTRDVNNLALLAPGVVDVRTYSFGSTLVPFSTNGSRGRDNNFIIDSVSNNEPLFGGAAAQFTNTDVFAEYTVLTTQLKAEFGRDSGATINAVTKPGYQATHGSVFWFGQQQNFDALTQADRQALLTTAPNAYENQAGFTLGGPFSHATKEKWQYFISYQWDGALNNLSSVFPVINTLPTPAGLTTLQGLPPTAALHALLATPTVSQVPGTPSPCFGNTPVNDPNGMAINPCYAPTLVPVNNGAENVAFAPYLVPNGNVFNQHDHQASARIDRRISSSDDFYGRYLFDNLVTPRAALDPAGEAAFGDLGLLGYWRDQFQQRTQSLLLNERHGWVNSLNEFRVSFVRIHQLSGPLGVSASASESQAAATVQDAFGGFGKFSGNFPSAGRLFSLGDDQRPDQTASNIVEVQENFSYTHGKHSFKFGADLIRTQTNISSIAQDLGHYFFAGSESCGNGLSQFVDEGTATCQGNAALTNASFVFQRLPNVLTDGAGNVTGQGPEELGLREFDQFFFAQDDWRVSPNLTLNLGVRYENFGQPINRLSQFNPAALHVAQDNKNFAPRIGLAWSPGDWRNTVFRGGYSIMNDPMVLNIPLLIWQSGPISPLVQYIAAGVPGTVQTAAVPSGLYPNLPFSPSNVNVRVPGCDFLQATAYVPLIDCSEQETVDPRLRNPYVQIWSFGVQRSFSPSVVMEIDYVGNKGTKNYQRVDSNSFGGWDLACLQTAGAKSYSCLNNRGNPGRGDIQTITNGGLSNYNALQSSLTKRTAHRGWGDLSFTGAYTLSHLIDNASEAFSPVGVQLLSSNGNVLSNVLGNPVSAQLVDVATPLPQDSADLAAERGNSSYDRRNRLAVSFVYELPHVSGLTRTSNALANGWQVNGIYTFQNGQPFSALNGAPLGPCADAFGQGILTNDRAAIGLETAPVSSVALVDDANCISTNPATQHQIKPSSTGYIDLNGNPIDPFTAHFVQSPLGYAPGQAFTVPALNETFIAGSSGRNVLVGPNLTDLDLALYKNFRITESKSLQFRWEVYDVLNHANPGFALGNVFAARAQQTFGFAFSPRSTPAAVTGLIPENSIDALVNGKGTFLSTQYMNTSNRRMQFGIHFVF